MAHSKLASLLQASKRVQVGDPAGLQEKIRKMVDGGTSNLQFIVDFDYTLTRSHKNGTPVDCSWGVLENYKKLGPDYVKKTNALRSKYHPIELDLSISLEEKIPRMVEWYTQANSLLTEAGVHKDWYEDMIKNSTCELRDDTDTLMISLEELKIPVLILSAGLGDLILEILKHYQLVHTNTKVVSNFCNYDEEGLICGLKPPMIHMYNKSESSIHDPELEHRHNVVLIGDSLGDLHMAEGVKNPNVILTIGFLNNKIEENLEKYKENFDVVLVDDQTMEFPLAILEEIKAKTSS
ncbi:7-methylguanosine phosphate-specific 5'-nucleotidase A [Eurytemora carolleeae]|uniref:7-methylguanosine phosphate-specific 5'-nucleotidase A n=1 Tax=Eurytemora carolleeae TaxID=1294199 RepID=UPI000C764E17|nr:7-methylguanosine phosphate-specific 5'-nucleotidase A [Eurytemora carolleeae]|eukprot:XP_023320162.1 7-methylguanosine phosphate-specific 5'-nucleotidase A-like [Eurytemora affinis]